MEIESIRRAIQDGHIRVTDHADEEALNDGLRLNEILVSVAQGEIIEDYPTDRPYPSCLVLGLTSSGQPVHSISAYNQDSGWAVPVTVYRPDPNRWVQWRQRRPRG